MNQKIENKIKELGPWRQDIRVKNSSTFLLAEAKGVNSKNNHPQPRWNRIKEFIPNKTGTALDVGCNAGAFCFKLEYIGWEDVVGIDNGSDNLISNPIEQARALKEIKESEVEFIKNDALEVLPMKKDLVLALSVIQEAKKGKDDRETQEKLIRKLVNSTKKRLIIENEVINWLPAFLNDEFGDRIELIEDKRIVERGEHRKQLCIVTMKGEDDE